MDNLDKTEEVKALTPREQEFLYLFNQNLLPYEITDAMGISPNSYRVYLYRLRKKGLIPPSSQLKFKGGNKRSNTELEERVQSFVRSHEAYFEGSSFGEVVDIEQVEEAIRKLNYRKQDVNLLIRLYVERNQFEEAINLLYDYESNNTLSDKEYSYIAKVKHKLRVEMVKKLTGNIPGYMVDDKEPFLDESR